MRSGRQRLLEALDEGVASIRDALAREVRVAVHCAAGLGRSGTLLAAYLVGRVITFQFYTAPRTIHLDMFRGQKRARTDI